MVDAQEELANRIHAAIAPIAVNGLLPQCAILCVLEPVTRRWEKYAYGASADWFVNVIKEDAITNIYLAARLISYSGSTLVDYHW